MPHRLKTSALKGKVMNRFLTSKLPAAIGVLIFFMLSMVIPNSHATTWFVKTDGDDMDYGFSWDEAFATIHKALEVASDGDDIWVEKGYYYPGSQIVVSMPVGIYGCFKGDETQRDQRDCTQNPTRIMGGNFDSHIFYVTADATIAGFLIWYGGGETIGLSGGGIYNFRCSPTIDFCTFNSCSANYGGAIANYESSPLIVGCQFIANEAQYGGAISNRQSSNPGILFCRFFNNWGYQGGAIYNESSSPRVSYCSFESNQTFSGGSGGGIYNQDSSPYLFACKFFNNEATSGGGIYNYSSPIVIANSIFSLNVAFGSGGALYNDYYSHTEAIHCTLFGNNALEFGGGVYNYSFSYPTLTNCILWQNQAPAGPDIYSTEYSTPTLQHCDISQPSFYGIATNCIHEDPLLFDPQNNDFHLTEASPCIDTGARAFTNPLTDFEGDPRRIDGNDDGDAEQDIGADEFTPERLELCEGDFDTDGDVDGSDLTAYIVDHRGIDLYDFVVNFGKTNCFKLGR